MKKVIKLIIIILTFSLIGINNVEAEEIPKIFLTGDISDMKDKNDEREMKVYGKKYNNKYQRCIKKEYRKLSINKYLYNCNDNSYYTRNGY